MVPGLAGGFSHKNKGATSVFTAQGDVMQLIVWRHAEAEDGIDDLERALTRKGRQQAQAMAGWLLPRLPAETRIISSAAVRAQQTAEALGLPFEVEPRINPEADFAELLAVANWPYHPTPVVLVGHQPTLGRCLGWLLAGPDQALSVKKGAIWWLSYRNRETAGATVLKAMMSPEMLKT
jgi:phosphohistidine phosphatase